MWVTPENTTPPPPKGVGDSWKHHHPSPTRVGWWVTHGGTTTPSHPWRVGASWKHHHTPQTPEVGDSWKQHHHPHPWGVGDSWKTEAAEKAASRSLLR